MSDFLNNYLKAQSEEPRHVMRGRTSGHCLVSKGHKHIRCIGKLFTTRTHKPAAARYHARHQSNQQEQFGVQHLGEGHFNMLTEGADDQIADPTISEQLTLPVEQRPPSLVLEDCNSLLLNI